MNRRSKNSLFNIADSIFLPAVSILAVPFFIFKLGAGDFGLWMLVNTLIASVSALNIGGANVVIKYVSQYNGDGEKQKIKEVFATMFLFQLVVGVLILCVCLLLSRLLVDQNLMEISNQQKVIFQQCIGICSWIFVIRLLESIINGYFKGVERFDVASILSIMTKSMLLAAQVLMLALGGDLVDVFRLTLLVLACIFAFQVFLVKKIEKNVSFVIGASWACLKRTLNFSAWNWLLSVSAVVVSQLDRWVVGLLAGVENLGYYSIVYMVVTQMHLVFSSGLAWIYPMTSRLNRSPQIVDLFYKAFSFCVLASSAVALFLIMFPYPFRIWLGTNSYNEIASALSWAMLILPVYATTAVPFYLVNGLGMIKYNFFATCISGIVKVLLMPVAYKAGGLSGVVQCLGLGSLLAFLFYLWVVRKCLKLHSLKYGLLLIPVICFVSLGVFTISGYLVQGYFYALLVLALVSVYYYYYPGAFRLDVFRERDL